jgi:hypothetical protein
MNERPPTPAEEAEYDAFMERIADPDQGLTREERSKFSQLSAKLAKKKTKSGKQKVKDPDALAAWIGNKNLGKAKMQAKAKAGKAKANK